MHNNNNNTSNRSLTHSLQFTMLGDYAALHDISPRGLTSWRGLGLATVDLHGSYRLLPAQIAEDRGEHAPLLHGMANPVASWITADPRPNPARGADDTILITFQPQVSLASMRRLHKPTAMVLRAQNITIRPGSDVPAPLRVYLDTGELIVPNDDITMLTMAVGVAAIHKTAQLAFSKTAPFVKSVVSYVQQFQSAELMVDFNFSSIDEHINTLLGCSPSELGPVFPWFMTISNALAQLQHNIPLSKALLSSDLPLSKRFEQQAIVNAVEDAFTAG